MIPIILSPKDSLGTVEGAVHYRFRGASGRVAWPMDHCAHLGAVGAWNIFFRMGYAPKWVRLQELDGVDICDRLLVISSLGAWSDLQLERVERWIRRGGRLLAAGVSAHWPQWLGYSTESDCGFQQIDNSYAALGASISSHDKLALWSPGNQPFLHVGSCGGTECQRSGSVYMVHGERFTPERALATPLSAPLILKRGSLWYANCNPFAGFQSWLQGQEDLSPWLAWRHRLFWLDEWVADFNEILCREGILHREKDNDIEEKTIVVLRHDLDGSRDTSYLEIEEHLGIPATHAILKDRNTHFWVKRLEGITSHESAFHYNTCKSDRLRSKLYSMLGRRPPSAKPARRQVVEKGLWRQVAWAKRNKIDVSTIHRHSSFLLYPEWIDAMDYVHENFQGVLGSSSLFRSRLLRWGVDSIDGMDGVMGHFPDAQFPYWYPFKLAHAGDGGRPLKGWETTCVMETEPEFFRQILDHHIPGMPGKVIMLCYHPAHANRPIFTKRGSREWFREIVDTIRSADCKVMTLKDVYCRMNMRETESL